MANPLQELQRAGQSVWCDYIRHDLLTSGGLQRLIDDYAVTGMTANPTIFEKAIAGSADYDGAIRRLAGRGLNPFQIYEALATDDVRLVADTLRPIYDRTAGADGFVSLEVSPGLAHDTRGSIAEATRLWHEVDRPNLMIKIPGTPEGIPAIEACLEAGLNINITLLFSVAAYVRVIEAYLDALERRLVAGQGIERCASVASFFVSRVDTLVDRLLDAKIKQTQDPAQQERLRRLQGKAAVANAKIAYRRFLEYFNGERFAALRAKGARVQRPLWASTSTKNPAYRDVLYVEELIGPDTVNTMPQQTLDAFRDHGIVARTVDADVAQAYAVMDGLARASIEIDAVTGQLLDEGIAAFDVSLRQLGTDIEARVHAPTV